ncbi:MAG: hypothetical protein IJ789_07060 [Bacteroidales bacterium]|nr:hypothetical protein [Bacteroidales bacterium]
MVEAYIMIVAGVALWALMVLAGKRLSDSAMRAITVFGGAFLLAVCSLDLLPELSTPGNAHFALLPYVAVLVGFLIQQILDSLSAHAEHGHTEEGFTLFGLLLGLSLHALIEGMPLVDANGSVNHGLLWGIIIHNIPVAIILVGLMKARGYGFCPVLALLTLFGIMSPLGSLLNHYVIQPSPEVQQAIVGLVVGVLLHVSSSILFDHKRNHFSWLSVLLTTVAFAAALLITTL